jgi:hypothetical protein
MKTIIKLSIQLSILILSSCSSTSFINRKYTTGIFLQQNKTLKHNTVSVDTSKRYASLNHTIVLIKPAISLTVIDDKEIINMLTNSVVKKDSVFHFQRRGRDGVLVKKCSGKHVLVVLNIEHQVVKVKPLEVINPRNPLFVKEESKISPEKSLKRARRHIFLALGFCLIPMVGFMLVFIAMRKLKWAKVKNPNYDFERLKGILNLAFFFSFLITLLCVLFILLIIAGRIASAGVYGA